MQNRSRSTIGQELGWLALWLLIFVTMTFCLLRFVVPHHFNDRVAVMLSALFSGLILIALRARASRNTPAP